MADLVALLGNISTSFCEHPFSLVFLASAPLISNSSEKVCRIGNLYPHPFLLLLVCSLCITKPILCVILFTDWNSAFCLFFYLFLYFKKLFINFVDMNICIRHKCMCVLIWVHMWARVCMCVHACGGQRSIVGAIPHSSAIVHFYFLDTGTQSLPTSLNWLGNKPQGSCCL